MTLILAGVAVVPFIQVANADTFTFNSIADLNSASPVDLTSDTLLLKDDTGGAVAASITQTNRSNISILEVDCNTAGAAVDFTFRLVLKSPSSKGTFLRFGFRAASRKLFSAFRSANADFCVVLRLWMFIHALITP